jgi:membrane protease YdiL (CAAX protease family)
MAAVRWYDGMTWTGLVHGFAPVPEPPERLRTLPLRAGFLGFAVLFLALLGAAVVAVVASLIGAPEWFATALIAIGGYGPVAAYVWWASRTWGTGNLGDDVGLRVRVVDVGWGPVTLLSCWAAQILVGILIVLLGLPQGSNTEGLFEDDGSWAVTLVIAISAVVVAPIVEEMLFRGVILRAFMSRFAWPWAVVFQGLMFGTVHLQPGLGAGNVSLILALTAVGIVLGGAAVLTKRLAASMIAHAIINAVALSVVFFFPDL